jgi:hypothetical protein
MAMQTVKCKPQQPLKTFNIRSPTMKNAAIALSVAALFASAAVSAQETSQLTRAQVVAESQAAVAAGNAPLSGEQYSGNNSAFVSTKTRADVRAELLAAQQRGEVTSGEQYQNQVPRDAP